MLQTANLDEQILKSRRALAAWQWMSKISNRPDEVVRLLNTEARLLTGLAISHPEQAATLAQLINGYKRLACAVQQRPRPQTVPRVPAAGPARATMPNIV